MTKVKVCSFNARGIRCSRKRRKLFLFLHRRNYDVIFLQETHSTPQDTRYWLNEWGGRITFSHGTHQSLGTAVLFYPGFTVSLQSEIIDENGRYIILLLSIDNTEVCFVNIYGPNIDNRLPFYTVKNYLRNLNCNHIIWGGDFNFVMNTNLDKIGGIPRTNFLARSAVYNIMQDFSLLDIWRELNPKAKRYTWHSSIDKSIHCRLDFFLTSAHLKTSISNVQISPILGSDHDSVSLEILLGQKRGPGIWKLNTSFLHDAEYQGLIRQTISQTIRDNLNLNPSFLWENCKLNIRSASISFSSYKSNLRQQEERALLDSFFL